MISKIILKTMLGLCDGELILLCLKYFFLFCFSYFSLRWWNMFEPSCRLDWRSIREMSRWSPAAVQICFGRWTMTVSPQKSDFFLCVCSGLIKRKKNSIPTNEVTNCSPELIYESALQSMRPDERCAGHFKLAHFINHLWPSRFISGAVCAEQMVVRILWRPIFWYGARNGKLANKFSINLIFY